MTLRSAGRVVAAQPTSDGAGVRLKRVIGTQALRNLDPFLMLDAFGSDEATDYIGGFPSHPHRGFETVTYMLAGRMQHRDSVGNVGDLGPGSVQWMTAGRGIIHSEMPQQEEGRMAGFQLWVNLPAAKKMTAPRYQDIAPEDIPQLALEGVDVRVLAGRVGDVVGPIGGVDTDPTFIDATLAADREFSLEIPVGHAAFAYVFEGSVTVPGRAEPITDGQLVELVGGDALQLTGGPDGGRAILLAGRPLNEPIVQYGPFVMNTRQEIQQAIADYQAGRFTDAP